MCSHQKPWLPPTWPHNLNQLQKKRKPDLCRNGLLSFATSLTGRSGKLPEGSLPDKFSDFQPKNKNQIPRTIPNSARNMNWMTLNTRSTMEKITHAPRIQKKYGLQHFHVVLFKTSEGASILAREPRCGIAVLPIVSTRRPKNPPSAWFCLIL